MSARYTTSREHLVCSVILSLSLYLSSTGASTLLNLFELINLGGDNLLVRSCQCILVPLFVVKSAVVLLSITVFSTEHVVTAAFET